MKSRTFALGGLLLATLGCADRTHMTPGYGQSYREILARQTANPGAGEQAVPARRLDTQEATAITHGYRSSLARKGEAVPQGQILFQASSAQNSKTGDGLPPASVPPE